MEFSTILILLLLFMSAFVSNADMIDDFFSRSTESAQKQAAIYVRDWQDNFDEKITNALIAKGKYSTSALCEVVVILKMAEKFEQADKVYESIPKNHKIPDHVQTTMAFVYYRLGKFQEAATLFESYLPKNEKDEDLVEMMVNSCINSGNSIKALKYLEARTAKGKTPDWLKKLLIRARHGYAIEIARAGSQTEAIAILKQLVDETGDRKEIYYDYIVILSWERQYSEAIKAFDEISSQTNIPSYVLSAVYNSYEQTGNKDGMSVLSRRLGLPEEKHVKKDTPPEEKKKKTADAAVSTPAPTPAPTPVPVPATAPKESPTIDQHISSGKLDEAINEIIRELPDASKKEALNKSLSVIHEKAIQAAKEGRYSESFAVLDRLIDIGYEKKSMISDKIITLTWAERYDEAIELFMKYRADNAPDVYLLNSIGTAYRKTGKYPEAIKCYDESLSLTNGNPEAVKGKVFTMIAEGKSAEAYEFIREEMKNRQDVPPWLRLLTGEAYLVEGKNDEAENFFSEYLKTKPGDVFAKRMLVEILIQKRQRLGEAEKLTDEILAAETENIDVMFLKVTLLQLNRHYIQAYDLNERILSLNRRYQPALNTRYHILMDMKAAILANDLLLETGDNVSIQVRKRLMGDVAAAELSWRDSPKAMETIDNNVKFDEENKNSPESTLADYDAAMRRDSFDKIIAYFQLKDMKNVISLYEEQAAKGVKMPPWIKMTAASAYLYCRNPEMALALYREVHEELKSRGKDAYPDNYNVLMGIYATLIELEKQRAAYEIIDRLDKEVPEFARPNGILVQNTNKMDIVTEKGWWYIYNNQLPYAEKYLTDLLESAPYNSNIRTALGYVHYYRGWSRSALEDFQIASELDPNDRAAQVGLAYTLNENDEWEEARSLAAELAKMYPTSLDVKRLQRSFELQQMRTLSVSGNYSNDGNFTDGSGITMRLDQPIFPDRKIYTQALWLMTSQPKSSNQGGARRNIYRGAVGFDWRLERDLKFFGEASMDYHAENPGFMAGLEYKPTEHLTIRGFYNSYTLNMPPKALLFDHKGQEANVSAEYRFSDDLIASAGFSNVWVSGGNISQTYSWRIDKGIYSTADWKFRVALEGSTVTNTDQDTDYYSPKYITSIYLVPMVEHLWYRSYETSITDRMFIGVGPHWEKDFECKSQYYLRYEQEYQLTDYFGFTIGGKTGKERFGDDSPFAWGFYANLTWKF